MATFYAIPTLSTWFGPADDFAGGWSFTSGGTDCGQVPDITDDVQFDANSGAARSVVNGGNASCRNLNMGSAKSGMNVQAGAVFGNITLAPGVFVSNIQMQGAAANVDCNGGSIGYLGTNGSGTVSLLSDLTVTSQFNQAGVFTSNAYNVSAPQVVIGAGSTTTMGSGTWSLTGTSTVWSNTGNGTIVPGSSTIKVTDTSATAKTFTSYATGTQTYNNFWHAGNGALTLSSATNTFANLRLSAGATLTLPASKTTTAASFTIDGTASQITINSSSAGTAATLAKSGGGSVYVDRCSIRDIAASPSSTFNARSSTNVSGNSNWAFISPNSNLLQFF